jgi:hypothetical protein
MQRLKAGASHDLFHNTLSLSLGALGIGAAAASVIHTYHPWVRRDIDELQDAIYGRELVLDSDKLD